MSVDGCEVMVGAGALAHNQGKYTAAEKYLKGSLSLYEKLDDKWNAPHW
jgi:hypothetical protein